MSFYYLFIKLPIPKSGEVGVIATLFFALHGSPNFIGVGFNEMTRKKPGIRIRQQPYLKKLSCIWVSVSRAAAVADLAGFASLEGSCKNSNNVQFSPNEIRKTTRTLMIAEEMQN